MASTRSWTARRRYLLTVSRSTGWGGRLAFVDAAQPLGLGIVSDRMLAVARAAGRLLVTPRPVPAASGRPHASRRLDVRCGSLRDPFLLALRWLAALARSRVSRIVTHGWSSRRRWSRHRQRASDAHERGLRQAARVSRRRDNTSCLGPRRRLAHEGLGLTQQLIEVRFPAE